MRIKLNDLTNLQDARYAAALGADYVGFRMERGALLNMAPAAVREIVEWLSGPVPVLAFGADADHAAHHAPLAHELLAAVELDALRPPTHRPAALQLPFGLVLVLGGPGPLAAADEALLVDKLLGALYLEVQHPAPDAALMAQLRSLLPPDTQLLLLADDLSPDALAALRPAVDGFSYGRKLREAFGQLDYDGFEALLDLANG